MNWIKRTIGRITGNAPAPLPREVKPLPRFEPMAQPALRPVYDEDGKPVGWST